MADASVQNLAEEERFIPEDLLVEILVRLPVTDIIRSKATCKRWHSLIESSSFINFHFRRHREDHRDRLLFIRPHHELNYCTMYSSDVSNSDLITTPLFDTMICKSNPDDKDNIFQKEYSYPTFLGPLDNGIYCWITTDCEKANHISVATSSFILFNHGTVDWKYTNPFPPEAAAQLSGEIAQNYSIVRYGFGNIVSESGIVVDYKVVVIILSDNGDLFLSFVYSLRRGTWEKIVQVIHGTHYNNIDSEHYKAVSGLVNDKGEVETPQGISHEMEKCTRLFLNGSWHWLELILTSKKYGDRVLSFDLSKELFGLMGGPPHDYGIVRGEKGIDSGLMVLNDHLAAVYMPSVYNLDTKEWCCAGFHVWMMMKYGVEESWTMIYSFETVCSRRFHSVMGLCYSIVTPTKDDSSASHVQIHRVFLDDYATRQLISIDGSRIKEHNFYIETNDVFWNTLGVSTYAETLHSLTLPRIDQVEETPCSLL